MTRRSRTILDEVVLGQTLQASAADEALGEEETGGQGELLALLLGPAMDVLEDGGERRLFEGLLEIFVSASR